MMRRRLKPMVRARRGAALLQRDYRVISREFEEALFRNADVLSEGFCRLVPGAGETYFGSTMISCDMERLRHHFRAELDHDALQGLYGALDGSVRLRLRAMRLACAEVSRRVGHRSLGTALTEVRFELSAASLHIDVDLEVPLSVSSGTGKP